MKQLRLLTEKPKAKKKLRPRNTMHCLGTNCRYWEECIGAVIATNLEHGWQREPESLR